MEQSTIAVRAAFEEHWRRHSVREVPGERNTNADVKTMLAFGEILRMVTRPMKRREPCGMYWQTRAISPRSATSQLVFCYKDRLQ